MADVSAARMSAFHPKRTFSAEWPVAEVTQACIHRSAAIWPAKLTEQVVRLDSFRIMNYAPINKCGRYVGWASAIMTFAGMGSFALVGIAADFLR